MTKVILTGFSGFVGRNLALHLQKEGAEIMPLSLRNEDWQSKISNFEASALIHLAGKAHDTKNTAEADEYFRINHKLTADVFNAFLQTDIRDFFYFSSVKAVADSVSGVLKEDATGAPLTAYGQSKLAAENYLLGQALPPNKRVFIIRPCMIHGPGNKGNLNLLYKVVKSGIAWPLAAFSNRRSFLSIQNLNYLITTMINSPNVPSGVYNFSDDDALSTNDVVRLIAEGLGRKARLWKMSTNLIFKIASLGDKISAFPLNSERLNKLTESYEVSNVKIKAALNIDRLPVNSVEGLKRTISSFRDS